MVRLRKLAKSFAVYSLVLLNQCFLQERASLILRVNQKRNIHDISLMTYIYMLLILNYCSAVIPNPMIDGLNSFGREGTSIEEDEEVKVAMTLGRVHCSQQMAIPQSSTKKHT